MSKFPTTPLKDEGEPSPPGSPGSPTLSSMTAAAARRRRKEQEEKEAELIGNGGQENVSVCIRVRPFNKREKELQLTSDNPYQLESVVKMPKGLSGYLQCMERDPVTGEYKLKQEFQYTKTFWSIPPDQEMPDPPVEPITQIDVFRIVGEPIIKYAFAGFNNCVFAYGQTGSGKTHTMTGEFQVGSDGEFSEVTGLIPRLCRKLFETIEEKKAFQEEGIIKTFDVQLNAIEIYNEQVRDLFWRNTPGRAKNTILQVRMHPTEGAFVDQLTILHPKDWRDCLRKIEKGVSERTVAATLMNEESSRSHSVFQIVLTQTETVHVRSDDPEDRYSKPVTYKKVSKINLVDLAGSERAKKSGAAGQQLKEASNINQSLFTLKKVIDSLVINSKETNPKKHVAIPFRESTLTRLLSDSLGGNSKTTMIACVSPHYDNQEETLLTLQYANRTGAIVNNTRVNEDSAAKQALALKHHILELQKRLAEGPVDEEAEELLDQIEVGRLSLKEMEEANVRTEKEFAEVQYQAKQEAGALFATAIQNTVAMVFSVAQKEQEDLRLAELDKNLQEVKDEVAILRERMKEATRNEALSSRQMDQLKANENLKADRHRSLQNEVLRLTAINDEAAARASREVGMCFIQRFINRYRSKKLRIAMDKGILDSHKEHEDKLSRVIKEAAEQYELQVRDFADFETSQQHKIAKLEDENRVLQRNIDLCTRDSMALMTSIATTAAERNKRLNQIDEEWKAKYHDMKVAYQSQIAAMEEELLAEDTQQVREIDELSLQARREHREAISALDSQILLAESNWKLKIGMAFDSHGDRIDVTIRELEEESHRKAITTRRECEENIRTLYAKLDRVKYMVSRHDQSLEQLRKVLQTMGGMHDRLVADAPSDSSLELRSLKSKLRRFEEPIESSPIRHRPTFPSALPAESSAHTNSGQNDLSTNNKSKFGYPATPVKIFNVFSQEKFDEANSRRFDILNGGASPQPSAASATNNSYRSNHHIASTNISGGLGVLNGSSITLLGGTRRTSMGTSSRPSLLPADGTIDNTFLSATPAKFTQTSEPSMSPIASNTSGYAGPVLSGSATPRRICLPENIPTPKTSLSGKQSHVLRSAPVRRL